MFLRLTTRRCLRLPVSACRVWPSPPGVRLLATLSRTIEVPKQIPKNREKTIRKVLGKKTRRDTTDEASRKSILRREIQEFLDLHNSETNTQITMSDTKNALDIMDTFIFTRQRPEIIIPDVHVSYMTSEGQGLALVRKRDYGVQYNDIENGAFTVVTIPKTLPGDIVTIKLLAHSEETAESVLIQVQNSDQKSQKAQKSAGSRTSRRKDDLIVCENFNSCNGCHFQMLDYDSQLDFKQDVIQKAYKFLFPELLKTKDFNQFGHVIPSPMEYSYRTKITPHYSHRSGDFGKVSIGFQNVDPTKGNVDVVQCPIATRSINNELPMLRRKVMNKIATAPRKRDQSTLVLRESIRVDFKTGNYDTVCLTDPKQVVTEKVGEYVFQFPANEFFQNNNSILSSVIDYVKYQLESVDYKHLVDTYCGSGFFGISLARDIPDNGKVFGIELAATSLAYADHNAKINGLSSEKVQFINGSAEELFNNEQFMLSDVKGSDSVVIMDPSRKGSNKQFLQQLLQFKPKAIVYVSCNVFTQARDLRMFMDMQGESPLYEVQDVMGFDFFPQTKHVESIAFLKLKEEVVEKKSSGFDFEF